MGVLGLINIASTFDYLVFYGYKSSLLGSVALGFLYPLALFVVAYFDFRQKVWAFGVTILLAGISVMNTVLGLRESQMITITVVDSILLLSSVVAAIASLLAFAKMSYSTKTETKRAKRS